MARPAAGTAAGHRAAAGAGPRARRLQQLRHGQHHPAGLLREQRPRRRHLQLPP